VAVRRRLDRELMRRELATSRTEAQRLVESGRVLVDGAPAAKSSSMVDPGQAVQVLAARSEEWASRAGHKLAGALTRLGVDPSGRWCLDVGASTGGFTDVLLRRGARRIVAVDVGYGQLRWALRSDDRVVVMDRTNARYLAAGDLPPPPADLVVADLSFISLRLVIPALVTVAAPTADLVLMVKPQFELDAAAVGRGGVVREPASWRRALDGVVTTAVEAGLGLRAAVPSPLPGPAGNVEFFLHLRAGSDQGDRDATLARVVAEGGSLADQGPDRVGPEGSPGPADAAHEE
jgi:23S rRNA (cytidine1920-2'-O)/16S rRNA (cytidine1409-2'-O)-methyltransferase